MKKYILAVVLGLLLSPSVHAASNPKLEGLFGLGDPNTQISYYDVNSVWKYYCFSKDCYDITTDKLAFVKDIEPLITDLQNQVINLQNQVNNLPAQKTVSGTAPLYAIDTVNAIRVKNEINNYISGLNSQINDLSNVKFGAGGYSELVGTLNTIKTDPVLSKVNWAGNSKEYGVLVSQVSSINAVINQLHTISYAIDDYLAGIYPMSPSDKAYLQSLGINW